MWKFSHWEVVIERGFWGGIRRVAEYPIYVYVDDTAERIRQYEREAQLALALKRKVDAESALLDSQVRAALRKVELKQLVSYTHSDDLRQLPYEPAIEMDHVARR